MNTTTVDELNNLPDISGHPPTPEAPVFLPDAFYLPDGTPLKLTRSRESLMFHFFHNADGLYAGPSSDREALCLLWACSHEPEDWHRAGPDEDGAMKPLYARPYDFFAAVEDWSDKTFRAGTSVENQVLAAKLWVHHHKTQVAADVEEPNVAQKKMTRARSRTTTRG